MQIAWNVPWLSGKCIFPNQRGLSEKTRKPCSEIPVPKRHDNTEKQASQVRHTALFLSEVELEIAVRGCEKGAFSQIPFPYFSTKIDTLEIV